MNSMTGYGEGEVRKDGLRVKVEISSINKKGLDVILNLPRELISLEMGVREAVQHALNRGRVTVNVNVSEEVSPRSVHSAVCWDTLTQYHKELTAWAKKQKLNQEVDLARLLSLPGVLRNEMTDAKHTRAKEQAVHTALKQALAGLAKSRNREGAYLSKELLKKVTQMEGMLKKIEKAEPLIHKRYQKQLIQRMKDMGLSMTQLDDRVTREVATFADRADISEEMTRLKAHLQEARRLLTSKTPSGRNLDFLMQELQREINTTGSKAAGLEIVKQVVAFKAELEKMREQVQNFE